ncbi:hypothetical protein DXG01_008461 [Tephrocybe rancida]|nr:hypothetical protein DXG01_008461 [Tephrocybe rancida]
MLPPTPANVLRVKPEPDLEDFTAALHPSFSRPPSPSPAPVIAITSISSTISMSRASELPSPNSAEYNKDHTAPLPSMEHEVPVVSEKTLSPAYVSSPPQYPTIASSKHHTPPRSLQDPPVSAHLSTISSPVRHHTPSRSSQPPASFPASTHLPTVASPGRDHTPPHSPQGPQASPSAHLPISQVFPGLPSPPQLPAAPLSSQLSPALPSTSHPMSSPHSQRSSQDPPTGTSACCNIPGLWFAEVGQRQADVMDCEFNVDANLAQKWHLSGASTDTHEATVERLSLRLLCVPTDHLQSICQVGSMSELVGAGAATTALASVKTVWPEQGSLLVQINPTKPYRRSWLPEHMGPTSPGLDITEFVREGTNVLRLIQLDDMADRIFMLQASLLPPAPESSLPTYWDVAALDLSSALSAWNAFPATVEVM